MAYVNMSDLTAEQQAQQEKLKECRELMKKLRGETSFFAHVTGWWRGVGKKLGFSKATPAAPAATQVPNAK